MADERKWLAILIPPYGMPSSEVTVERFRTRREAVERVKAWRAHDLFNPVFETAVARVWPPR